ncbi:MAG: sigma-54-dependent transcriptional regulator [Pyrinomonadaceae bacterium]
MDPGSKSQNRALVIDDDAQVSSLVAEVLRTEGFDVSEAASAEEAMHLWSDNDWDVVFCDVVLGGNDGYQVLARFSRERPETRFILMTGHASAAGALDATAKGAYDYLLKPFSIDQIASIARSATERVDKRSAARNLRKREIVGYVSDIRLIGKSREFVECLKMVGRVSGTELPILIAGESGTGKEVVARAIHQRSRRAAGPFVAVNCGAIPVELIESELFGHAKGSFTGADRDRAGLWEEADGGTIFLDEITETGSLFQVKLLRALQEGEIRRVGSNRTIKVNVRVIAATNRDIEEEARAGRFRQDLMYRLNAVSVNLPPLRERRGDIPLLVDFFAANIRPGGVAFSSEAMDLLCAYDWPGNVRELENAVLRATSLADDVVRVEHLPPRIAEAPRRSAADSGKIERALDDAADDTFRPITLAALEARYAARVLEHTGGNKQAAARILDIDRKTLTRILRRAGLDTPSHPE